MISRAIELHAWRNLVNRVASVRRGFRRDCPSASVVERKATNGSLRRWPSGPGQGGDQGACRACHGVVAVCGDHNGGIIRRPPGQAHDGRHGLDLDEPRERPINSDSSCLPNDCPPQNQLLAFLDYGASEYFPGRHRDGKMRWRLYDLTDE